jgi:hypothetical protein
MKNIQPLTVIFLGLFLCSLGFNIVYHKDNQRLIYQIQKIEAGPARGLFLEPNIPKPKISDEELNELMKQIIKKFTKERTV